MPGIKEFVDGKGNKYIVDLSLFNRRVFVGNKVYTSNCINSDKIPEIVKDLLTTSTLSVEEKVEYEVITDKEIYRFKRLTKL